MTTIKKPVVAKAKWEVASLFAKVVEAEGRTVLLECLVRKVVGLNKVERFFGKTCDFLRGVGKGVRQEGKIINEMKSRGDDSRDEERLLRSRRGKASQELEVMMDRSSKVYKSSSGKSSSG